jgi:hypothetical protein
MIILGKSNRNTVLISAFQMNSKQIINKNYKTLRKNKIFTISQNPMIMAYRIE